MHSPPSSPLFFSSPRRSIEGGPTEEVEDLYSSAREVNTLNRDIARYISGNKTSFLQVFGRQVELLKSRSQAFEDAHVTVYDKVLLLLTDNGNNLESPAAIAWYCAEYLGIDPTGEEVYDNQMMEQAIAIPVALTQVMTPSPSRKSSKVAVNNTIRKSTDLQNNANAEEDLKLLHLMAVYSRARTEYLAVAEKHDFRTLEAAKFLRDTAENGIQYLQDKHPRHPTLKDLNNTYNVAKTAVLNLNGGKKRKFDERGSSGRYRGREYEHHLFYTPAHNRAHGGRRHQYKSEQRREQKRDRGRGPSGIPYGYTRPVDSYHPV